MNAPVKTITEPIKEPLDLLFLGGSVYAAGIDNSLKAFIAKLKPEQVKRVAIFSTAAVLPSAYPEIKKCLEAQDIPVMAKEFHCRGRFAMLHLNRPNQKDLNNAASFAKEAAAAIGK